MYLPCRKSSISIMRLEFASSQWTLLLNSQCYGRVLTSLHGFLDSAYAALLERSQSMIEGQRNTASWFTVSDIGRRPEGGGLWIISATGREFVYPKISEGKTKVGWRAWWLRKLPCTSTFPLITTWWCLGLKHWRLLVWKDIWAAWIRMVLGLCSPSSTKYLYMAVN